VEAIQGWNWIYNHSSHSCSGNSTRPIPPVICAKKNLCGFHMVTNTSKWRFVQLSIVTTTCCNGYPWNQWVFDITRVFLIRRNIRECQYFQCWNSPHITIFPTTKLLYWTIVILLTVAFVYDFIYEYENSKTEWYRDVWLSFRFLIPWNTHVDTSITVKKLFKLW
jgi:hypothetical protein